MTENPYTAPKSSLSNDIASKSGLRVEGNLLVCPATVVLPERCIKTNEEIGDHGQTKHKRLYWSPLWIIFTVFIAGLITIILYLTLRKKLDITYSLSSSTVKKYRKIFKVLSGAIFACIGLMFFVSFEIGVLLALMIIFLLIGLIMTNNVLVIKKFKNGEFYLKGCHPEFLDYVQEQHCLAWRDKDF